MSATATVNPVGQALARVAPPVPQRRSVILAAPTARPATVAATVATPATPATVAATVAAHATPKGTPPATVAHLARTAENIPHVPNYSGMSGKGNKAKNELPTKNNIKKVGTRSWLNLITRKKRTQPLYRKNTFRSDIAPRYTLTNNDTSSDAIYTGQRYQGNSSMTRADVVKSNNVHRSMITVYNAFNNKSKPLDIDEYSKVLQDLAYPATKNKFIKKYNKTRVNNNSYKNRITQRGTRKEEKTKEFITNIYNELISIMLLLQQRLFKRIFEDHDEIARKFRAQVVGGAVGSLGPIIMIVLMSLGLGLSSMAALPLALPIAGIVHLIRGVIVPILLKNYYYTKIYVKYNGVIKSLPLSHAFFYMFKIMFNRKNKHVIQEVHESLEFYGLSDKAKEEFYDIGLDFRDETYNKKFDERIMKFFRDILNNSVERLKIEYTKDRDKYNRWTPLHEASRSGTLDDVKAIIEATPEGDIKRIVNSLTRNNQTPLKFAVSRNDPVMLQYLIEKGADVDLADEFEATALHQACIYGFYVMAEILLANGANVNAQANYYNRMTPGYYAVAPYYYAVAFGHDKIANLLKDHGANLKGETYAKIERNRKKFVSFFGI